MIGPVVIIGAPSAIGIRPYDDGSARRLDLTPGALRDRGLARRLAAKDLGDVVPPQRFQDAVQPEGRARNEDDVAEYSARLAERIAAASQDDNFILLLGGDCSILLGSLLGLRAARGPPVGLAYIDAHADFGTLDESPSGSACSMNLAVAVGRADTRLAHLDGDEPLVGPADVVHIGRRDDATPGYGCRALVDSPVLNLPHPVVREKGPVATAQAALKRVSQARAGFWIHLDADVLDPVIMPAVDTPLPDGLGLDEVAKLLAPLVRHPKALGLQVTIYDPSLDPGRWGASRLVSLLEQAFTGQEEQ
jgi:arginase